MEKETPSWLKRFLPNELDNEIQKATQKLTEEKTTSELMAKNADEDRKAKENKINTNFKEIVEAAITSSFHTTVPPRLREAIDEFATRLGVFGARKYTWTIEDKSKDKKYQSSYVDLSVKESLVELLNRTDQDRVGLRQEYKFAGSIRKSGAWSFGITASRDGDYNVSVGSFNFYGNKLENYTDEVHIRMIQEMAKIVAGGIGTICYRPTNYGLDGYSGSNQGPSDTGPN